MNFGWHSVRHWIFLVEVICFSAVVDFVPELSSPRRALVIAWKAMMTYGAFVIPYLLILIMSVRPRFIDRDLQSRRDVCIELYQLMLKHVIWWGSGILVVLVVWNEVWSPEVRMFDAFRLIVAPMAAFVPTAVEFTDRISYGGKSFVATCLGVIGGIALVLHRL